MGLLSGDGAALLGSIFSGIYLPGRVFKIETVYDNYGEIVTTETEWDCRLMVDAMTEAMRRETGSREQDRRIIILSTSTTAPIDTDCEVICDQGPYSGVRFQVASIDRDPCGAYWQIRGSRAS
jgi:hypothetical protein